MSNWRRLLPWWSRIGAKIVLSRLPIPYSIWKRLGLFEHGDMNVAAAAFATLVDHARSAGVLDESRGFPLFKRECAFTVMEIGPGDSLASGVAARALGADRSILIDAGDFASRELALYREVASYLSTLGYADPLGLGAMAEMDSVLRTCAISYLTDGLRSLAGVPSESIDFCFSNAVMEHIPAAEFAAFASELRRVLKVGGVCVHRVDFQDHLGGGLNNLRFSKRVWEGRLFAKSGFYTNRIRLSAMRSMFEAAGFRVEVLRCSRWTTLPIGRAALDDEFKQLSDDELLIYGVDMRLTPSAPEGLRA
jgi:SAM-dependent methyltransferase